MRGLSTGAIAIAAVLGTSAMTLTAYASPARAGSGHASSYAGSAGRARAGGGAGGTSSGGTGIGCGQLDLTIIASHTPIGHSNDLNNLGGGQLQLGDGSDLLGNLFTPVLSSGGGGLQSGTAGRSRITTSDGANDSADTGNDRCGNGSQGGDGAKGGSATGGNGGRAGSASARGGHARSKIGG
jgi:hypothetical protein